MSLAAHDVRERPELPPSWPSQNNCNSYVQRLSRQISDSGEADLPPGVPAARPISFEADVTLRDEARQFRVPDTGEWVPVGWQDEGGIPDGADVQSRYTADVLREFRRWIEDYQGTRLVFENGEGETVTAPLKNSYMSEYADIYYARLKQFERAVRRHFRNPITVMTTHSASHENDRGLPRATGDHMREIEDGRRSAFQRELYDLLSGYEWEYVRIWEPHKNGYGHQHIGIVIEGGADVSASDFVPFMEAYVDAVDGAGSEAHSNRACEDHYESCHWEDADSQCERCETPVSVNTDVENMGSYLSEYLGIYGEDESVLERPVTEQLFYATTWATNTRRIEFSQGAQELIEEQRQLERREEVGATPEQRGGDTAAAESDTAPPEAGVSDPAEVWHLAAVEDEDEERHPPPQGGGVESGTIDGANGWDRPKLVD